MRALIEDAQRLWARRRLGSHAVVRREDGRLIGEAGILAQRVDGRDELELSYTLARHAWGCGYATEAGRALLADARAKGVARIVSLVRPENVPSRRVAERLGAHVEGETMHAGLRHLVYVYP